MFTQKTKLQLCAKNLTGVEYDLTAIDFTGLDLVGAINGGDVIGDTVLTVDGFSTNIPTGCIIGVAGDDTVYYVVTGASSTSITIYPPLKANAADNAVVTIYPHFDITQYWTNDVFLEQQAEFQQAELILDRPLRIELFNKNSVFYDRDTHSTGWGLTTAYFSTYNAQSDTDNQYIRISVSRNGGAWRQKYNGKIIQHTLELDEINHTITFDTESVFYGLKDVLVSQIDELYYLHKYTSSTRKTKTPSGRYIDVIRALFKYAGVQPKNYTVTNKEKSNGFNLCILTIGTHSIVAGELITVNIGDTSFDGTHIVYLVTSTTIYYYNHADPYEYTKDDVNATVAAGNSSFVLQTGLSPASDNYNGYCKISGDTQIYTFFYTSGTKTVTVDPVLAAEATIGDDVYLSYPTIVASGAASGTVTAHRIFFDLYATMPTDYFNAIHQGHTYNLLDLFWITEKWMVQDVESETAFSLFQELCLQLGACCNIDYIAGIAYGFFRSKINTSTSKVTLTSSKIIGQPKLNGNWPFYSASGVAVNSEVVYWNQTSIRNEFCYVEDLNSGDYQRYLEETPSSSVLAYERYSTGINAASFNNLAINDRIIFSGDDTIYKITGVSGESITITPPLRMSIRRGHKFAKVPSSDLSLKYSNLCNLKLKYPNIFLTDPTNKTIRKYWNNGTATLGIHPMSFYTSAVLHTATNTINGVALAKNVPCGDGYLIFPNGDLLLYTDNTASDSYLKSIASKSGLPNTTAYELRNTFETREKLQVGYCEVVDTTDNSVKIYNIVLSSWYTPGAELTQISRLNLLMENYGDTASVYVRPSNIKRNYGGRRETRPQNIPPRLQGTTYNGQRNGFSAVTANANEFGLYRVTADNSTFGYTQSLGEIGASDIVYSMFLNHDVLNPDYDDMVYADAEHAECIQKCLLYTDTPQVSEVLTGTPPTAGTVWNFIVNHGESTAQEYYYCDSTDGSIMINDGTAWTDSATLLGAVLGGVSNNSLWGGTYPARNHTANVKIIRKAYDNFLVAADPTDLRLLVVDIDSDLMIYIEDTTVLDSIGDIDIQCFTNWWDYQGATNATIFENDICFNASKLAYKFYSKNRRPYVVDTTDTLIGYIDYSLFDRVTIDSGVLSAASGSPKFYVYGSRFNLRTHDHKLILLESVE